MRSKLRRSEQALSWQSSVVAWSKKLFFFFVSIQMAANFGIFHNLRINWRSKYSHIYGFVLTVYGISNNWFIGNWVSFIEVNMSPLICLYFKMKSFRIVQVEKIYLRVAHFRVDSLDSLVPPEGIEGVSIDGEAAGQVDLHDGHVTWRGRSSLDVVCTDRDLHVVRCGDSEHLRVDDKGGPSARHLNVVLVTDLTKVKLTINVGGSKIKFNPKGGRYGLRRLMSWRSWVRIPAPYTGWTFFTFICCKIVMFVWKDENKQKEAGFGPF